MDRKIAMHKRLREISKFVDQMYGIDTCEDELTAEEELKLTSEFADQVMMEEQGVDCDEDDCASTKLGYCPCRINGEYTGHCPTCSTKCEAELPF